MIYLSLLAVPNFRRLNLYIPSILDHNREVRLVVDVLNPYGPSSPIKLVPTFRRRSVEGIEIHIVETLRPDRWLGCNPGNHLVTTNFHRTRKDVLQLRDNYLTERARNGKLAAAQNTPVDL